MTYMTYDTYDIIYIYIHTHYIILYVHKIMNIICIHAHRPRPTLSDETDEIYTARTCGAPSWRSAVFLPESYLAFVQ